MNLQIITRYCEIEKPYAESFFNYYKSLGIKKFAVITQSTKDFDDVTKIGNKLDLALDVQQHSSSKDPNKTLKDFDRSCIDKEVEVTTHIDMDEYLWLREENMQGFLSSLTSKTGYCYKLKWMMHVTSFPDEPCKVMTSGKATKQFVKTVDFLNSKDPLSCHVVVRDLKLLKTQSKIIHMWSRSFNDALLKVFMSRIRTPKTERSSLESFETFRSGKLPKRLKCLALLKTQARMKNKVKRAIAPEFTKNFFIDKKTESDLLFSMISKEEYEYIVNLYKRYESNLYRYYASFNYGRNKLSLFDVANNLPDFADD